MSLHTALNAYRRHLPPGHRLEFGIDGLDRLGVPVQTAVFFPKGDAPRPGTGFGLSAEAAKVGALGELTEDLQAGAALRLWPVRRASYRDLRAEVGTDGAVDPVSLNLPAGSPWTEDDALDWGPVERLDGGGTGWLPIEFLACSGADWVARQLGRNPLITPITNGLGAGLTFEHAVTHGLLELLQRDGNGVRYRALAGGVAIDPGTVDDPEIQGILRRLDAAGIDARIKLAGTEFGMANVYVVGAERDGHAPILPIMAAACGEAVHPVARVAIRKALLEFISSRSRLAFSHGPLDLVRTVAPLDYLDRYAPFIKPDAEEPRAMAAMDAWSRGSFAAARARLSERVLRVDKLLPEAALPTTDPGRPENDGCLLPLLTERLRAAELDVWVARFTPAEHPVQVVKVVVPGLEAETMSYGRIGARNVQRLFDDGRTDLVGLGEPPPGAQPVRLTAAARDRLGGDPWFNAKAADRLVGDLYAIYREPSRHALPWRRSARGRA